MIKILVIGEKCTDRFMYCDVSRFSPEAPVPVLNPIEVIENDGMAGNVVRNLIALNKDISVAHWYQDEIITKTRFVEKKSNHMFLRLDEGEEKISNMNLINERISEIYNYDVVIVSDYDKGFISDSDLLTIGKNSKVSILDSKRKLNKEIVNSFTFVKLNEKESLQNKELLECNNILITLGSKGTKFKDEIYPSPNPQETIDVSGAGDTFISALAIQYCRTKDIESAIIYGNECATIVVQHKGVTKVGKHIKIY
jgi:D-beta-D-heptose 7-phosphate kinase/D-beta-D-heptose 1-phosphate adenosyltransferase